LEDGKAVFGADGNEIYPATDIFVTRKTNVLSRKGHDCRHGTKKRERAKGVDGRIREEERDGLKPAPTARFVGGLCDQWYWR